MKLFTSIMTLFLGLFMFAAQPMAQESPVVVDGAKTVSTTEAKALFDKGVKFVDVRKNSDWDAGRIPGAAHIESKKKLTMASLTDAVAKDVEVVFYCNGALCMRSSKASIKAVSWGYSKVYYYRDGFPAWEDAGLPVE